MVTPYGSQDPPPRKFTSTHQPAPSGYSPGLAGLLDPFQSTQWIQCVAHFFSKADQEPPQGLEMLLCYLLIREHPDFCMLSLLHHRRKQPLSTESLKLKSECSPRVTGMSSCAAPSVPTQAIPMRCSGFNSAPHPFSFPGFPCLSVKPAPSCYF